MLRYVLRDISASFKKTMCSEPGLRPFGYLVAKRCSAHIFDAIRNDTLSSLLNISDYAQPDPHARTCSQDATKLSVFILTRRADDFCVQSAALAIYKKFSNNVTSATSKCSLLHKIDTYYVSLF